MHTSTAGLGVTSPFDADAAVQKAEEGRGGGGRCRLDHQGN